ncbi:hypothetical protein GF314_17225 [bacterium]|nr:hypothetical protein [bacterium]
MRAPRARPLLLLPFVLLLLLAVVRAQDDCEIPGPRQIATRVGLIGLTVSNYGDVGNYLANPSQPSCEYPLNSNVEHMYHGGLWIGARKADGTVHVSTAAQDANGVNEGEELLEFESYVNPDDSCDPENFVLEWSNSAVDPNYTPEALSTQHIQAVFDDSGQPLRKQLGVKVTMRALAWSPPYADDFVILDYAIVNASQSTLFDVYVGFWNDNTVGNTTVTNPYDDGAAEPWNFWDDFDGCLGAVGHVPEEYTVPSDPDIWMMWERDDDGEEGLATSWVGNRLLGALPPVSPPEGMPPVSYHAWRFRGVPEEDSTYVDEFEGELPGKYQLMSDGGFTVGETQEGDYSAASNWVQMMATGPWPVLSPGDTIRTTFAVVCGADSLGLLANSRVAQLAYEDGFQIPGGPPSPVLQAAYEWNTVKLQWAPGDTVDADGNELPRDHPARSPEFHVSEITGEPDFQGYRVYRYQGLDIEEDPYSVATLVAQFDIVDGVGFDTGLPPLNEDGRREFVDTGLRDGLPYWYSVVSYSAPNVEEGLPEFPSGFNENAMLVFPGPAPVATSSAGRVTVAPNPYRAGSHFDNPGGEVELGRKIWFLNLPPRCRIKIYTVAGDLVRTLEHEDPVDGKIAWDVLSEYGRAIASGLYVYVVENLDSGEVQRGKLVIIK